MASSGDPMHATRGRSTFSAIVHKRCPRCGEGRVFSGPLRMNEFCPTCGLRFDRGEPGYFTGAMYVSYALLVPVIALATLLEYLVLPGSWSLFRLVLLAWALTLPLIPVIWQYSRVMFMHFDQWADPDPSAKLGMTRTGPGLGAGPTDDDRRRP